MNFRHVILVCLFATRVFAEEITAEQTAFYTDKILPIFAENCYKCHSAEGGKDKGGLTLDTRDAMLKGGDTGPSLVPGDVAKSLLITAVAYTDPDLKMPPKGDKLSPAQVADLTAWVKQGALVPSNTGAIKSKLSGLTDKARRHWAYQSVTKPAVPINKNQQWCRTPVDCFILQKVEAAGMLPAPDANKETLIRRAYYDLVGLPPSPQEIDAFLGDKTPQAWGKVVDHLLASPHYGERWGRHWMDTARYADTAGANANGQDYRFPHAWTYRDWVVNAINADMPYDHFIVHQLAADLLPKEMQGLNGAHLAALGFITIGERFGNGNDQINEKIDTVSKAFLAMTVTCARCHDHMFDPISQKDYYALHGVFSSITEPSVKPPVGALPPRELLNEFAKKNDEAMKEMRDGYYGTLGRVNQAFRLKAPLYLEALAQSREVPQVTASASATPAEIRAMRQSSPFFTFLRSNKLDEETARALERRVGRRDDAIFGPLARLAEIKPEDWSVKAPALLAQMQAGAMGQGKKQAAPTNPIVLAMFKGAKPANIKDVWMIYDKVFAAPAPKSAMWIDEIASSTSPIAAGVDLPLADLMQVPYEIKPGGGMGVAEFRAVVDRLPNRLQGPLQNALTKYNLLLLTHPGAPAHAMIVADKPKAQDSPVFIRGQANSKGEIVPRRFLEILSPGGQPKPFTQGSGRLELAQAIASRENPLTARVLVNRVWMHHFGEAFVPTPDDLGTMSEKPTHPELLDYLANYVMDNGWSLKKLHRLLMMSRVYQQSSHVLEGSDYKDKDPYNNLLWRANVRRLDFESVRDSLLVFSGQLDGSLGGKPVNLTDEPYSYRRSVYGYVDRGNLPELMANFDFAKPEMANSKRTTTVVPQQALFLMNSPMSADIVRRITGRPEFTAAKDDLGRISAMYKIIFQRMPTKEEYAMALSFVKVEAQDTEANSYAYKPPRGGGGRGMDARAAIKNDGLRVARRPLNAWETYAQALLFSNEAAYVN